MVVKDRNHPCVIMYSIGNEIAQTASAEGIELNRQMAERTRALDPERFVTNCINGFLNLISFDQEKWAEKQETKRQRGDGQSSKNLTVVLNYAMGLLERSLDYLVRLPRVDRKTRDAYAALDIAGYNYMVFFYVTE